MSPIAGIMYHMTRTPIDDISQRRLVYELRLAIDRARAHVVPSQTDLVSVYNLVSANPYSINSRHVQHNIGASRRAWLADFTRNQPLGQFDA